MTEKPPSASTRAATTGPLSSGVFWLVVSLHLNVALAVVLVQQRSPSPGFAWLSSGGRTVHAAPVVVKASSVAPKNDADPALWSRISAGDLTATVARLRAAGISGRMLRAIVNALLDEQFADRHRAIADAIRAKAWWRGQPYEAYSDPKITAMRRQLVRDQRLAFYQLVGPETPENDYDRAFQERRYGSIGPDKIQRLREISADYDDLMAEVRAAAKGIILPEDREKLAYLEQQKQADIAKVLTPDEQFELNLHSSPTAKRLRDQLAAFEPTEEEFRAIFKIQQAVDAQFGTSRATDLTQDERRQRRDLANAASDEIRGVLSPERFAEYQMKSDPAYRQTSDFVAGLSLSPAVTAQVVALQRDTRARMEALVADRTLSAENRTAQFTALSQQVNNTLNAALGSSGVAAYKQMSIGNWVNSLDNRVQPRPGRTKN